MNNTNMPRGEHIRTFREGPVAANVFRRSGSEGPFLDFVLSRAYTPDEGDTWRYAETFNPRHSPALIKVIGQASSFISQEQPQAA